MASSSIGIITASRMRVSPPNFLKGFGGETCKKAI